MGRVCVLDYAMGDRMSDRITDRRAEYCQRIAPIRPRYGPLFDSDCAKARRFLDVMWTLPLPEEAPATQPAENVIPIKRASNTHRAG